MHAVEAILRFCSLAAIARLRADRRDTAEVVQTLCRPSFGTWAATCRSLTETIKPDPLRRWLQGAVTNVEVIVQHRNDTAHGGGTPSGGIENALTDVDRWMDTFLLAARSGPPVEMVVAGSMTYGGGNYTVDIAPLAGAALAVPTQQEQLVNPLHDGHAYLRTKPDSFTDLWPFVMATPGNARGDWSVSVLDGVNQRHREGPSPSDRLRYVDVATGTRAASAQLVFADLSRG